MVLSVPSAVYAATFSIPGDNTLGIDTSILQGFAMIVAELNAIISAMIPTLASSVLTRIAGQSNGVRAAFLIAVANLMFLFVVPVLVVIYFNIACFGVKQLKIFIES